MNVWVSVHTLHLAFVKIGCFNKGKGPGVCPKKGDLARNKYYTLDGHFLFLYLKNYYTLKFQFPVTDAMQLELTDVATVIHLRLSLLLEVKPVTDS